MSERTFFTLRYALPGYTFILMSILVAYPTLKDILFQIEVAAFLAFFSLLSGGALGFLVSQVWYVFYLKFRKGKGRVSAHGIEVIDFLRERYRLTDDVDRQIIFLDYVHRLSDKETLIYTQRRYDLMHICGSTLVTTIIGSFFGLLIRFGCLSTKTTFGRIVDSLQNLSVHALGKLDLMQAYTYDLGVIIIFLVLVILLCLTLRHAQKEYAMMIGLSVRKVVNSGIFPHWKARKVFSDDYFSDDEHV